MKSQRLLSGVVVAALMAVGCAVQKSENPLSPSIAGPIPGVEISAPKPLEPAAGAQIPANNQPLTLLLENASSSGVRPLTYLFEVATDAGFGSKVFSREGVTPGDSGRTSLRLPDALGGGRSYYWRAKAQDGANTGPYSAATNFNVFTPVAFDAPGPTAPINNDKVATPRPDFKFTNAPHVGSPLSVNYAIEVATSDTFANKIAAWQVAETANNTTLTAPVDLPLSVQLFWHVRAFDGGTLGTWSATQVFRTPTPAAPTPTPAPGGGGGAANCASQTSQLGVVQCQRANYGFMTPDLLNQFLRAVARDLNAAKLPGGPFGLLQKTGGNQCLGYSCDIICSTSGQIWDVLGDSDVAQFPIWADKGTNSSKCDVVR